jgi:toxin CptA
MHSAASVIYPVARSRRVGWLVSLIWCLGLLSVGCWLLQVPAPALMQVVVAAWSVGTGLICLFSWWRAKTDFLAWDGRTWRTGNIAEARVTVVLDFQSLLLVRVKPYSALTRWIFVDRHAAPALWHSLRCALVASAHPGNGTSDPVSAA